MNMILSRPIPFHEVNDRMPDAIVGSQMKKT
jgi:hypothetical protein